MTGYNIGKIMKCAKNLLILLSLTFVSLNTAVTFKDGAYSGIQIKVDENLPIDNCREILSNLEVSFYFSLS